MSSRPGRFEFRIWGNDLSAFQDRLTAIARPSQPRESAETYVLSRVTDAANVKIRDGVLDVKVMTEQLGRLERWRPVLKAGFPIDSRAIVEQAFPSLRAIVKLGLNSQPNTSYVRHLKLMTGAATRVSI